jgi:hypothetical protein
MTDPHPTRAPDVISSLEALATALAGLEPELERWLVATVHEPAERERARRAAMHLRMQASRIVAVLDAGPAQSPPAWHGQERRGPNRATNVARLPERSTPAPEQQRPSPEDWEPF